MEAGLGVLGVVEKDCGRAFVLTKEKIDDEAGLDLWTS